MNRFTAILVLFIATLLASATLGCGTSTSNSGPIKGEFTTVTPLLSSSANALLSDFFLPIQSITLTNKTGTTVNLLSNPQNVEFISLNGNPIPLASTSVPQDVYTSAGVTFLNPSFICLTLSPSTGGDVNAQYGDGFGVENATVNLASPLTVSGQALDLSLNLLVAQSMTLTPGCGATNATYTITPVFDLSPLAIAGPPTSNQNGKETGIFGSVDSVNTSGNSFSLFTTQINDFGLDPIPPPVNPVPGDGLPLSIAVDGSTVYQGISGLAALNPNMFVDMDVNVQSDGSLLATRIAAYDQTAPYATFGPLIFVSGAEPAFFIYGRQEITQLAYSFSSATAFQTSGQFGNLADLPFVPSFNATNMVAGQNAAVFSQLVATSGGFPYTPASTVTLMPQTINGTVASISSSGGFTAYTVTLAPYDLFPTFAVQSGQTTLLANPNTVVVYADSNTRTLNSTPIAVGSVMRFNGLVFNDNGTLRMDCAQINDGVPE